MTNARSMPLPFFRRIYPFPSRPILGRPPRPGLEGKVVKFVKVKGVEIACFLGEGSVPGNKPWSSSTGPAPALFPGTTN